MADGVKPHIIPGEIFVRKIDHIAEPANTLCRNVPAPPPARSASPEDIGTRFCQPGKTIIPLPADDNFRAAAAIAEKLTAAGYPTMIVGGAVRDLLLGKTPHDFDLVTTAVPEESAQLFPDHKTVGASFGVTLIKQDGREFEVATAREERNYMDGRHPESVRYTRELPTDAARRDFTINAMMLDPASGGIHDHHGGLEDLQRGLIRTVGTPEVRFAEDHLRMLRAVRFAARLGFEIAADTADAIRDLAGKCRTIAAERLRQELNGILTSPHPDRGMELLSSLGILQHIMPEVEAMHGVTQPPEFHPEGDVWQHTMLMLREIAIPDELLAWSVLLHDVGKPLVRSVEDSGRIRFFDHEGRGADIAADMMKRLRFANSDREAVEKAIRNHMRFASVREMKETKLRRLLADSNFTLEMELHRLDCLSCHGKMECFVFLIDQLIKRPESTSLPEPFVRGRDLTAAGFKPQPAFSAILQRTYDRQLAGEFSTPEEAMRYAKSLFTQH